MRGNCFKGVENESVYPVRRSRRRAHARIESRTKFTVLRKFFRYDEGL